MENELGEIRKLLEKNTQDNQEILARIEKIDSYLKWQKIWSLLKIILIIVPIIFGYIILSPMLKEAFEVYQELLGAPEGGKGIYETLGL